MIDFKAAFLEAEEMVRRERAKAEPGDYSRLLEEDDEKDEKEPEKKKSSPEPARAKTSSSDRNVEDVNKEFSQLMKEKDNPGFTMKLSRWIIEKVKNIYRMTPEELAGEETNIIKFVVKLLLLLGVYQAGGVLYAVLAWYIDRRLRVGVNLAQKARLIKKLETELEMVESKLADEKDPKEKDVLIKVKNHLKSGIAKLATAKTI